MNKKTSPFGADGKLAEMHNQRVKTAGRVGTKRFVDPCKVFIGNLPFNVDEEQLQRFVLTTMGQSRFILHSAKIIRDWKTGKSKGYGFCIFTDPIYATVCIEVVNGKPFEGRAVSVGQGKKKDDENQLYLKKKRKKPVDAEEASIASALDEAESDDDGEEDIPVDGDSQLEASNFDMEDELDDDEDIFLERRQVYDEVDPKLNREQRREAQRKLKRKKMPHKGFG